MEAGTRKLLRDYGWTILIAVAAALFIRFYVVEAYRIPTLAMRPTLEPGDTVFVAKTPLGIKISRLLPLSRGEVVLYSPDQDEAHRDYIKRIIALPGDTVAVKDGRLEVNGRPTRVTVPRNQNCGTEQILDGNAHAVCFEPPTPPDYGPVKVPDHSVFVLGDLRTSAQMDPLMERKSWGIIPASSIGGKVLWVWLSIEPHESGVSPSRFPKLRFERMFRRVE